MEFRVCSQSLLNSVSPVFWNGRVLVVDERAQVASNVEVSCGGLVASNESFSVGLELLVKVGAVGRDSIDEGFLGVVIKLAVHNDRVGLAQEVV